MLHLSQMAITLKISLTFKYISVSNLSQLITMCKRKVFIQMSAHSVFLARIEVQANSELMHFEIRSDFYIYYLIQLIMAEGLKNIKGGGLHYVADFDCTHMKLFRAGLKHYRGHEERLIKGQRNTPCDHDIIDYERGAIIHSRSPTTQYFNFHYMYGGFKKYVVDRYLVGTLYRNAFRIMWFPGFLYFIFGCYHMRLYDNAAHDFFYFSD